MQILCEGIKQAGALELMTPILIQAVAEHSMGNLLPNRWNRLCKNGGQLQLLRHYIVQNSRAGKGPVTPCQSIFPINNIGYYGHI